MRKKNIVRIVLATALLLLVPFVAMQFTDEETWSVFDFAVAGTLLLGTGFAYELVASRAGTIVHKLAVAMAIGAGLLLIWVNLAAGIIGSEDNPANVLNFAVLAVGIIGAIVARLEPRGMAWAMFTMALTQAVIAMITMAGGFATGAALTKTLFVNGFFVTLWVGSALLFRWAASERIEAT